MLYKLQKNSDLKTRDRIVLDYILINGKKIVSVLSLDKQNQTSKKEAKKDPTIKN